MPQYYGLKAVNALRGLDYFGRPITLNHKGDDMIRTIPGACLTILMAAIMVMFSLYRAQ